MFNLGSVLDFGTNLYLGSILDFGTNLYDKAQPQILALFFLALICGLVWIAVKKSFASLATFIVVMSIISVFIAGPKNITKIGEAIVGVLTGA